MSRKKMYKLMSNQYREFAANDHTTHLPSEAELDLLFDQQANKAWTRYEHLKDQLENKTKNSDNVRNEGKPAKDSLESKAMHRVREFWQDNKDHLVS